jgi:Ca-activated chloride channel family protein
LRDVDAAVFAIGLGPNVDRETLQRVASASGGRAYFPLSVEELPAQYARVIEDLRRRYVLSYTSSNSVRNGGWRQVELRSRRDGVAITSRGGYRAPDR